MRLFVLVLSMACVVLYGYALAGFAGYSFGRGRADYVVWGLAAGTLCGAAALFLWKKWTKDSAPDLLIFDVDGVLLDARDSFLASTAETVRWCWGSLMGGVVDCEGYTLDYFNLCKAHPAFNDDSVVAWALLRFMGKTGRNNMKDAFPSLAQWGKYLKDLDLTAALKEKTWGDAGALSRKEVLSVLEEFYYGKKDYLELRGTPKYGVGQEGFWAKESPGTLRNWKEMGLPVGIYTGRSLGEMVLARRHLNWPDFPRNMLISSDDGILKPSPLGLSVLCERAGARYPLFFGDTASDKAAWLAFGKGAFVAIGPILKPDATKEGFLHFDTLEEALSALLPAPFSL
ncbi:MAG: HAD family hydrolase [Synergistaceae bacterium]|jgi:phosphoglycolate phosphatase-like HAD superfamily hydrolase|nr:HAD family hydrolase [Synergistaceae bacterium]